MTRKNYRVFEGLRVAACLTFISGYLNAFTFVTQGGRFAGIQSGNMIAIALHFSQGNWREVGNFSIPILFFVLGQFFTYTAKNYFLEKGWPWHLGSSLMMLILISINILLTPIMPPSFTISLLAFVASIQIETFRKLRGAPYANVMMTGNIKNASYLWWKGMFEHDKALLTRSRNILITIVAFLMGVVLATKLASLFSEYALIGSLPPFLYVNIQLWNEKRPRKNV